MTTKQQAAAEVAIEIPHLRTEPYTNAREHHMARHRRATREKRITTLALSPRLGRARSSGKLAPPYVVTITRVAPGVCDDDNLPSATKYVRDAIAKMLGIDDGDPQIAWRYMQVRDGAKYYAVRIRIQPRTVLRTVEEATCVGE